MTNPPEEPALPRCRECEAPLRTVAIRRLGRPPLVTEAGHEPDCSREKRIEDVTLHDR